VHDALRVRVRQPGAQRNADLRNVAVTQRALLQQLRERAATHQLRHEVRRALLGAGFVERHDRRMREPRRRSRLARRTA
jgi:hypothetical protein